MQCKSIFIALMQSKFFLYQFYKLKLEIFYYEKLFKINMRRFTYAVHHVRLKWKYWKRKFINCLSEKNFFLLILNWISWKRKKYQNYLFYHNSPCASLSMLKINFYSVKICRVFKASHANETGDSHFYFYTSTNSNFRM